MHCILNGLAIKPIPDEIAALNDYGKLLIQCTKAFQVVNRMGTVAGRKIPHRQMVQKVKGRTFHLPLPVQETLKLLLSRTQVLCSPELFIMATSMPTPQKIVWSDLVSPRDVLAALS